MPNNHDIDPITLQGAVASAIGIPTGNAAQLIGQANDVEMGRLVDAIGDARQNVLIRSAVVAIQERLSGKSTPTVEAPAAEPVDDSADDDADDLSIDAAAADSADEAEATDSDNDNDA